MRIIPLAYQAIRKLALIGLLLSPFILTPGYAAELVGKPVPVGTPAVPVNSAVQSSSQTAIATEAAATDVSETSKIAEASETVGSNINHAMEELGNNFHQETGAEFHDFGMSPDLLIPIVAISLLFGGPVLLVIILAILHYRAKARRQQDINANIDKLLAAGRDIPIELLLGETPTVVARNNSGDITGYRRDDANMHKGVRNIGLGAGWLIFLTILCGIEIGAFGFIFIGLGISQVVIWKLSGPSHSSTPGATRVQE